jgi:hypothetical protein
MEHENQDTKIATRPIQPMLDLELGDAPAVKVVVRPDLNLEKWPLWEASNSRHQERARILHREIRLPDGSVVAARVEVGYSNHGTLTTEDQKTCYGLFKLWEDLGKPKGRIHFSRQQLARVLKRSWGSKVNKAITDSLMRLRFTPFVWEHSYYDSGSQETVERIDTFNILSELHLARRVRGEATVGETSYFEFNDRILANLLAGFTRPVYLDTILTFQSEVAQILYTYLDLIMADKTRFERRTRELFEDLGIDGSTYRYRSKRAQVLEPALRELDGVPVPTGVLYVTLEQTVDKTDFKIVVTKTRSTINSRKKKAAESGLDAEQPEPPIFPPPVVTRIVNAPPDPAKAKSRGAKPTKAESAKMPQNSPVEPAPASMTPEAAKTPQRGVQKLTDPIHEATLAQVRYFHQIFFQSGDTARPTARERELARDHIERLGVEKAEYLVLFAYREARKTSFQIQNYGGIAQYEGRAVAEFDANEQQRRQALLQKSREGHQRRFQGNFHGYLRQRLAELDTAPTADFEAFLEEERRQRERLDSGPLAGASASLRVIERFESEEARFDRFRAFLKDRKDKDQRVEGVLTFWEWDEQLNPEKLNISDVR